MPIADRAKTAVLSTLEEGAWTLLGSVVTQAEEGWDTLQARYVADFRAAAKSANAIALDWLPGTRFGADDFWLSNGKPQRLGGNVWQFEATYKGRVAADYVGGTTTSGSAVVVMSSTNGLRPGMRLLHANISKGCFISSVDSATQVTLCAPATASGSGLTFRATRGLNLTVNATTEGQSAEDVTVTDIYGANRLIPRISVSEAAPTFNIEYVLVGAKPPTANLGQPDLQPIAAPVPDVRASFWSWLAAPVENWPSGWSLNNVSASLLTGTQVAPHAAGVWLVTESFVYKYRYAAG